MAIRIRGQVKDQIRALIKAHPDWLADELIAATKACFPGENVGGKSTISILRRELGMGRYQKRTTKEKAKAKVNAPVESVMLVPPTVEGKVRLIKAVAEALARQVAEQADSQRVMRRFYDDGVGPGHPERGLYREAR